MAAPDCLGSGEYAARIVRRPTKLGPAVTLGELPTLEGGSWARLPQATTDASVTIALQAEGCVDVLNRTEPWRDQLELYRNDDVVWMGPIQELMPNPGEGTATVTAKDDSVWWDFRVLTKAFVFRNEDLATIFAQLLGWAFLVDNPGFVIEAGLSGIKGDLTVAAADLRKLSNELSELARTGVDWTAAGRKFWIGGAVGRLPIRLTDEAFVIPPNTRRSGVGMVTEGFVRGNGGITGHAGGPDPDDGVLLQDVRDAQSIEDQGTADAAATTWVERSGDVMTYVEGDAELEPGAPVEIQTLIPGVIVPVDVGGAGIVPWYGDLRLESVNGEFGNDGEHIKVGLQPIGTPDEAAA